MTSARPQAREIDGDGRTVRQLLTARKYSIDYYQREYKWQTKQVTELIDDLSNKFLESHEPGHDRQRPHQSLRYRTPAEVRQEALGATQSAA